MKKIYLLLFCSFFYLVGFAGTPDFSMVGFATQNGGTTGGNSAATITDVYTGAELISAIGKEKTTTPRIIRVNGTIEDAGDIAIKRCENITLVGADANAKILKSPIIITSSKNIIIRNLTFSMVGKTGGKDIIEITTTSSDRCQNIWVDHCEFYNETPTAAGAASNSVKDRYDGLLDIKKNSEYITISWCYFHDHYKAILVGFTDNDTEDRKITMHHNRFERINSRMPSYRGGTAHIYNNYFEGWIEGSTSYGNCIHAREGCNLLVENNYFTKINSAVYWDPEDAAEGFAYGTGNYFADDVTKGFTAKSDAWLFVPPYGNVVQDDVMDVPDLVKTYAGVGVITAYNDYGAASSVTFPSVTITSPNMGDSFESPASVPLSVTASDTDGTISKVEFYRNNELTGTLTSSPYNFEFDGLMSGTYVLSARAYDDAGNFATQSVVVTVKAPVLTVGESIFGSTAPENGYFWFGENASIISSMEGSVFLGATFNATLDPQIDNKPITTHTGGMSLPKEGGYIVFALPSCTLFELYMTRTGSFGGNVYASTDNINWSESLKGISGAKGFIDFECSDEVMSASPIYIKIENTSSGSMNIHGANIRIAGGTTGCVKVEYDRELVSTKYFTLSGAEAINLAPATIYIAVKTFDDGSVERSKVFNK